MNPALEDLPVKIAVGLFVALVGIILSWLWLMQQQITSQQVTDSEALGKISVLEMRILSLKEVGSTSAQQAIIAVHRIEQELVGLNGRVATRDDIGRIEKRLDRIEQKR